MINPDLTTRVEGNVLNLENYRVTHEDISIIKSFIREHPEVTSLNLANNNIGPKGVEKLAKSKTFSNLTSLNLANNNIGPKGVEKLAKSKTFSNLTSLDLADNHIGDEGAGKLVESRTLSNLTSLDLADNHIGDEGAGKLVESRTLSNLTSLDLADNHIGDEGAGKLVESRTFSNLTSLNLAYNNIKPKGVKKLLESKTLSNLTSLDLYWNKINDEAVNYIATSETLKNLTTLKLGVSVITLAGVNKLATSEILKNLTTLKLAGIGLGAAEVQAIVESKTLTKLTNLDLGHNQINDIGVRKLIESDMAKQLTILNLENNKIETTGLISLAKWTDKHKCQLVIDDARNKIITILSPIYKNYNGSVIPPEAIKDLIFTLAPNDNNGSHVQYFLERPDKYLFAINSLDQEGHTLDHYYNNNTNMLKVLFNLGFIPRPERHDQTMRVLAADNQAVHHKYTTEEARFVASKMMETYGQDKTTLLDAAELCKKDIEYLKFNLLEIKLLGLSESGKRNTLEKLLKKDEDLPNDEEFVKMVTEESAKILKNKYLDNKSGYYTHRHPYNDQGDTITIPETIGVVHKLLNNNKFPIEEEKELLVTLIIQNPELTKQNLPLIQDQLKLTISIEQLSDRAKCHELLKNTNSEVIAELFYNISKFNIYETLKKQKLFRVAESLYWAANTYGKGGNACVVGAWIQVVNSALVINPDYLSKYADYKLKKSEQERLKRDITAKNIEGFIPILSEKLIIVAKNNPSFGEALADFCIMGSVDFDKLEETTISQQRVMGQIYQTCGQEITKHFPNYNWRQIPKFEGYKIIVDALIKDPALKKFATMYYEEKQSELQAEAEKTLVERHAAGFIQQKKMVQQQFKTAASDIAEKIAEKEQQGWVKKLATNSASNQQQSGNKKRIRTTSLSSSVVQDNWNNRVRRNSVSTFFKF
jgi:hypothetical protein